MLSLTDYCIKFAVNYKIAIAVKENYTLVDNYSLKKFIFTNFNVALSLATLFFCIILLVAINSVRERRKREEALNFNSITQIWNYEKFCVESDKVFSRSDFKEEYAILHVNIAKFRFLNDIYGLEVGNYVLRTVAKTFKQFAKRGEIYASLWADRFVCLVKCSNEEELRKRSNEFLTSLNEEVDKICDFRLVMRVGVYFVTPEDIKAGKSTNHMFQYANHALSSINDSYRDRVACFDQSLNRQIEALKLVDQDMLKALSNGEFVPYYQPKYNIYTNEIIGAEALLRWLHPQKGIIPPCDFVPYFEKSGFIVKIDLYIFEKTCKNIKRWLEEDREPILISCNFSRVHFESKNFAQKIMAIAGKYNIPFELLELELTETIAVEGMSQIAKEICELHDAGFKISIDDFGSGYSSLSVLHQLKVDTIKLDKTFLESGIQTETDYKVLQAVVNLGEQLHLNVICEGVETEEQVELLKNIHCNCAQGFYYAKPMPVEELDRLLAINN